MLEILKIDGQAEGEELGPLRKAAQIIQAGGVLAIPTDTVYGLATAYSIQGDIEGDTLDDIAGHAAFDAVGDAADTGAVSQLYELKQRPLNMPIALLVASTDQAEQIVQVSPLARKLMNTFWPGALTLVLPAQHMGEAGVSGVEVSGAGDLAAGVSGFGSVGVRCPDHDWVRSLLNKTGPLAVTSANLHGESPCLGAAEVEEVFGEGLRKLDSAAIVNGYSANRPASTVVALKDGELQIIREGSISLQVMRQVITP